MLQAFWIWAYTILQIDNNVMKYNVRLILCDNSKSQVIFFRVIRSSINNDVPKGKEVIFHTIFGVTNNMGQKIANLATSMMDVPLHKMHRVVLTPQFLETKELIYLVALGLIVQHHPPAYI